MKKILPILCLTLALLFVQNKSFAQQPNQSLTVRYLWNNYVNPQPNWENWEDVFNDANENGFEVAYGRRLHKGTWLMIPAKLGTVAYPNSTRNSNNMIGNLDLLLHNNLCSSKSLLNPNVHLGIGSTWDFRQEKFDFNLPVGVGLNLRLGENFYVNAQTQYRFSIENRPGWQHGVGLVFYFGGEDDRDGDGVSDQTDRCPDDPGSPKLMGCPDRDGDGVADIDDKCPDQPGLASLMGCPDRDGDGVADNDDKCPDTPGLASLMGCPDRDGDGVADNDDECPDVPGLASLKGCPDADGDGIPDDKDKCPREAGPASTGGCPDRDGDGVADKDDACPDKPGDSAHKGCPDSDGDGIYDHEDRCPDVPGVASLQGCPEVKEYDKAVVDRAIRMVQFESGKATLLKSSIPVMDELVGVMNSNPSYNLSIGGHTDNVGDDKMNQDLSERRAKTCFDYLVGKGIAANRLSSAGYGETQPKGDNNTAAGRLQNRRVEFELMLK